MIIKTKAYARAGVIGNPSDGYFGKTIACIVKNFSADVLIYETPELKIEAHKKESTTFNSITELVEGVKFSGYYGGIRLIKATIKRFYEYCQINDLKLSERNFTIRYDSNIPLRVGLAGSSAIVTATLRGLMQFYAIEIPKVQQPTLVLSVETEELGIVAGLQDRVAQIYEGAMYMDFNRDHMEEYDYGNYEELDCSKFQNLFIAYREELSEGTEVFHNNIRERWTTGDVQVREAMVKFAQYTEDFREALDNEDIQSMKALMNQNFDLRASMYQIDNKNWQLINTARNNGASAKFCGSGGAIVGIYDNKKQLKQLKQDYLKIGARVEVITLP